jgi:glycosyltransferase involved in cell wall biosynthesis
MKNKKKKILVIGNIASGMRIFRTELLCELLKESTVYLSATFEPGEKDYFEKLGCICIPTSVDRRGTNPIADGKLLITYIKILRKLKPDIVLTYSIKPNIYAGIGCQLCNIHYIATVEGLGTSFDREGFFQKFVAKLYYAGLRRANTVFILNEGIKKKLIELGISTERMIFTPGMGANLNIFKPEPYPTDFPFRLLTVGRIMREKGFPEIIAAAKILEKELPNLEWHICGAPEANEQYLLDELMQCKNIIYHGQQSDMHTFYAMAHATTTTTYHEGMSTVCLESGACARPVLGTDIYGVRETIEDGVTGFLLPPHDVQGIVDNIKKFFSLPNEERAEMGRKARMKIEQEFDRQMVVKLYFEKIYGFSVLGIDFIS